ncbi:MAG: 16S rRNA (uracil(1498)-N(3))-methyltransferase [Lentisphaeria bacterium]|nr:16S rRNA (uracil(1498)-N(3))-methyltransferase [Lentisphaeria bacterium]
MHSFRYDQLASVRPGDTVTLEKGENTHLFKILRAAPGDVCRLLDGKGNSALARVEKEKTLTVENVEKLPPLPGAALHLFLAPPRRQKMDIILKQCTELGVASITPLICERSVALPDADSVNGRWSELLFEACKQSGNPYLPQLFPPVKFTESLETASSKCGKCFYGSVAEEEKDPFSGGENEIKDIGWFVGPEGGFTEEEEEKMKENAFHPLHMQCWILRAETAAICGLALLRDRFLRSKTF